MKFGVKFKAQASRFLDRPIASRLNKVKRSFLRQSGATIRKTAKRRLRKAPQKKDSELTEKERTSFKRRQKLFRQGKIKNKPRRPERKAAKGHSPLLHMKPKSPLREMLFFFLDDSGDSVLVGPSQFNGGNLEELEKQFPFMEPAYKLIEPKLPSFLAEASK
jgi:hypothetical protein